MAQEIVRQATPKAVSLADAGAVAAGTLFAGLTLAQWSAVVEIGAGLAAVFAGVAAGIYHITRIRKGRSSKASPRPEPRPDANELDES